MLLSMNISVQDVPMVVVFGRPGAGESSIFVWRMTMDPRCPLGHLTSVSACMIMFDGNMGDTTINLVLKMVS